MQTLEKFCPKWNDFKDNINTAFASLRKDSDFTDVTLACEDGHQVEAHKVILSASSPFFENILKRNIHARPLIYMRGMKSEELIAIIDFLYYGEANIYQETLDNFLILADELKLKGLTGGRSNGENHPEQSNKHTLPSADKPRNNESFETKIAMPNNSFLTQPYPEQQIAPIMSVALPKHEFSEDIEELDRKIETVIGRGENMIRKGPNGMIKAYICQICGKEGQQSNIKDHIEANHLAGFTIPCSICEKTFRSRDSLRHHIKTHKSQLKY